MMVYILGVFVLKNNINGIIYIIINEVGIYTEM
jgi:hypothetical protein